MGYGDDGELPEMGIDHDRLGVGVGDDSDAAVAQELRQFLFELGAEIGILKTVDSSTEALGLLIKGYHTGTSCAQV